MSRDEVIDILLNEMECVQRASDDECNRDCAKCDLLRDTDEILQAYRISIKALEHPEENVVKIIPHGDLISRQAVIDALTKTSGIRGDALKALYDLPSVTPQQKIGRWIDNNCSICGYGVKPWNNTPYCPNCSSYNGGTEKCQ